MPILFNEKKIPFAPDKTLRQLLTDEGFIEPLRFVVAVNQEFVPNQQYAKFILADGDAIEVLAAMVGG